MIFYLTFNDHPSGIFSSQVIDVVKFMNHNFDQKVKLISFISIRNFFNQRAKIKRELPESIILPMFPGVHRWRLNIVLLSFVVFLFKPTKIIGRSVLATQLALKMREKGWIKEAIYDGRGAIGAEWKEYKVVENPIMLSEIFSLEKTAVLNSNYRIAVSHKMVEYWEKEFAYNLTQHVVIPCTLNQLYQNVVVSEQSIKQARNEIGFSENDVVFIYSGSVAGWQSFDLLKDFMVPVLKADANNKLMFLSDIDENILSLKNQFPDQVSCQKLKANEVPKYLLSGDYGLLIREESVTNKVASPVKFAEYIVCGLKVIISNHLGDYSEFVENFSNGILNGRSGGSRKTIAIEDRIKLNAFAKQYFSKSSFINNYKDLLIDRS